MVKALSNHFPHDWCTETDTRCSLDSIGHRVFIRVKRVSYGLDRDEDLANKWLHGVFFLSVGGTAGSVVASRLSDIPEWKVLLLEAGPDEPPGTDIPSMVAMFLGSLLSRFAPFIRESIGWRSRRKLVWSCSNRHRDRLAVSNRERSERLSFDGRIL